jgi:hypothetical protein
MLMVEKDWDKKLLEPLKIYNDLWAVTARAAVNLSIDGKWYNVAGGCNLRQVIFNQD